MIAMTMLIIMQVVGQLRRDQESLGPNGKGQMVGSCASAFEAVTDVRINHATFGGTNLIVALITIEE